MSLSTSAYIDGRRTQAVVESEKRGGSEMNGIKGLETERNSGLRLAVLLIVSGLACVFNYPLVKAFQFFTGKSEIVAKFWLGSQKWHYSSPFVDWFGGLNHRAKVKAASQEALDIFYNAPELVAKLTWWKPRDILTRFWLGIDNCKAVRNRVIIITHYFTESILELSGRDGEVRGVSMACGSAQAVVDGIILSIKKSPKNIKMKYLLIDKYQSALDSAKKRVVEAGLEDYFIFEKGETSDLEDLVEKHLGWVNLAEIAGFPDYVQRVKLIKLFKSFKRVLVPGGIFITCNICPNPEKPFLDWDLLWWMIYRTKEEFSEILKSAEFFSGNVFCEPLGIHAIAVVRA